MSNAKPCRKLSNVDFGRWERVIFNNGGLGLVPLVQPVSIGGGISDNRVGGCGRRRRRHLFITVIVSLESDLSRVLGYLHEEDCPSLKNPLWVIRFEGRAGLDEQRHEDLRAV